MRIYIFFNLKYLITITIFSNELKQFLFCCLGECILLIEFAFLFPHLFIRRKKGEWQKKENFK